MQLWEQELRGCIDCRPWWHLQGCPWFVWLQKQQVGPVCGRNKPDGSELGVWREAEDGEDAERSLRGLLDPSVLLPLPCCCRRAAAAVLLPLCCRQAYC